MIFVIKIGARGDLLLSAPAFLYLRESRRGERIVLIVGESCRDVAEHLPFFDAIHTIDDRLLFRGSAFGKMSAAGRMLSILRRELRRAGGSAGSEAIILHRDWRYGLVALLAGIPTRRGFASGAGDRFLTHAHRPGARDHHEDQYLAVAGASTSRLRNSAPLWRFAPGERETAVEKASALGLSPARGPLVALGFGGGRNAKMSVDLKLWPIEGYVELARGLEDRGYGVVWLGDRHDAERLGEPGIGVNLAGRLTVPESAAVVSECRMVIANDTMLLHLARALDVHALGLFGPTDPAHTGPHVAGSASVWLGPDAVPCAPCHRDGYYPPCHYQHRCMREMHVGTVLRTAVALLHADDASLPRSVSLL